MIRISLPNGKSNELTALTAHIAALLEKAKASKKK